MPFSLLLTCLKLLFVSFLMAGSLLKAHFVYASRGILLKGWPEHVFQAFSIF